MLDAKASKSLELSGDKVAVWDISQVTTEEIPSTIIPHRSGRIIRTPDRFMFLDEACEAIPEEPELDPRTYNEASNDVDVDR